MDTMLTRGTPPGVVFVGGRGRGKTRLLTQAYRQAVSAGLTASWVSIAPADRGLPLSALAHVVDHADGLDSWLVVRQALLRRLGVEPGGCPVLIVDDLHQADEASIGLVCQLAIGRQIRLIASIAADAVEPPTVTALWKDRHAVRQEVPDLSEEAVSGILGTVLGGPVEPSLVRRLNRMAAGDLRVLSMLVAESLEAGRISQRYGYWFLDGPPKIGEELRSLVRADVSAAGSAAREVVELVCVAGSLSLSRVTDLGLPAEAVICAEEHGLVRVRDRDWRMEPASPLIADVVTADIAPFRRRWLCERLTTVDVVHDDYAVEATRRAADDGDYILAAKLSEAAANTAGRPGQRPTPQAVGPGQEGAAESIGRPVLEAALLHADALSRLGDWRQAESRYAAVDRPGAGLRRLANLAGRAEPEARRLVHEVVRLQEIRPTALSKAVAALTPLDGAGPPQGRVAAQLIAGFDPAEIRSVPGGAETLGWLVRRLAENGCPDQAARLAALAGHGSKAPWCGGERAEDLLAFARCVAWLYAGHRRQVERAATRRYQRWIWRPHRRARWAWLLGRQRLLAGDLTGAQPLLLEAAALVERESDADPDGGLHRSRPLTDLAIVSVRLGERERAGQVLRGLNECACHVPEAAMARAWAAATSGDVAGAVVSGSAAIEACLEAGAGGLALLCLLDVVRFASNKRSLLGGTPSPADGGPVTGRLFTAAAEFLAAAASQRARPLETAAHTLASLGVVPAAVDGLEWAAAWYQRSGAGANAVMARRKARVLAGLASPQQHRPGRPRQASSLTAREFMVAGLAAEGLPNQGIAARLEISVRTVENHLQNVYGKLYIGSRAELGQMFHQIVSTVDGPGRSS